MISNKQRAVAERQHFDFEQHVSEQQDGPVADYLRSSPEFFTRHPQLLMEIEIPHYERGAVSLVEKRLALHREQYDDLRDRLGEIVEVAHRNDQLADLLHDFSMALISAESINDVLETTRQTLNSQLNCVESCTVLLRNDVVDTCLDECVNDVVVAEPERYSSLADLHGRKTVYCGPATPARIVRFFPNSTLDIRSVAIIKLLSPAVDNATASQEIGYLALASDDKHRFAPHMATDFLRRFGELFSARLAVFY
jgi:uncharacterized protein YigA (DUF484 family)